MERTDEVDEQAEGHHPEHEQDEVGDVVQEAGGGRDEPEERHEDGDGGDDLRVEEAALGPPAGAVVVGMEVGPDQAGHGLREESEVCQMDGASLRGWEGCGGGTYGSKRELTDPQRDGHQTSRDRHVDLC